jgi:adenylyltransferase/sulfurtransferase
MEMDRYSRQIILDKIGQKGQEKIRDTSIAIVGLGALGTVASELLTRAGIGKLILIDRDYIEESNLQRQTLYNEEDTGKFKAETAAKKLEKINSDTKIDYYVTDLNHRNISKLLVADLILDCTDNLYTRYLINEYCSKNKLPWIYSAAIKEYGNVTLFHKGPCFRCVFEESESTETCDTVGILNTITSTIASIAVTESLKFILNKNNETELIRFNIWDNSISKIKIKNNENCLVCKGKYPHLEGKKEKKSIKYCGNNNYQFYLKNLDYNIIKDKLKNIGKVKETDYCFIFDDLTVFNDGRILVKENDPERAKSLISKYIGD